MQRGDSDGLPPPPGRRRRHGPVLILLAGASNSGKSTLARALTAALEGGARPLRCGNAATAHHQCRVRTMHQDDYFREPADAPRVRLPGVAEDVIDWDVPDALRCDELCSAVEAAVAAAAAAEQGECSHLIVEGHVLFLMPRLVRLSDLCVWLDVEKRVAQSRRAAREYDIPDPPSYFELVAWPHQLAHAPVQLDNVRRFAEGRLLHLDGSLLPGEVLERVLRRLEP